jgi:hypothetical protein
MGSCLSHDKVVMTIAHKPIRHSQFLNIKTYRDAVQAAGQHVPEYTYVTIVSRGVSIAVQGHEKFQFVDEIRYKGVKYPIKKLYGKDRPKWI